MQLNTIKQLLDKLGFGSLVNLKYRIETISLSEIEPIPLSGNFDSGFALGEYSISESAKRKRTRVGDLLFKFKYEQDQYAGTILSDWLRISSITKASSNAPI